MLRAIVGLVKGLIVGGGIGYALLRLGWDASFWAYVGCALVGALVGVVCGRAPWKSETIWTPVVKMIVGAIIGSGLCALGRHFLPDASLPKIHDVTLSIHSGSFLAVTIGVLYGMFVEIDDGGKAAAAAEKDAKSADPAKKK